MAYQNLGFWYICCMSAFGPQVQGNYRNSPQKGRVQYNCSRPVFFAFAIFLVFCIYPLYSQDENDPSGYISSIDIIGLRRTKNHVAHYPLEKYIGREASSLDLNEVYATVKDTGILELVSAELIETEEGIVLRLIVKEKWALFPVPLVLAGSGGSNFGFFLVDRNAFGLMDQAVIGGMYGTGGITAVAMYNHAPNQKGQPGWNSLFMYGRREREDQDKDEKTQRLYTTDQLRFSFGLYYPFTGHFTGSAALSFSHISLQKKDINPPPDGAMLLGFTPGVSLRSSDWDGYLLSQQSLSLTYHYNFAIQGTSYHQMELRAVYEKSIIPGFRLAVKGGAVWTPGSDPLNEGGPQRAQVDILPRNFSARHYAGFSAGLEKHLVKFQMGALSVLGLWQCVYSDGPISGNEFDYGPSGGLRFYLSQLALPAMGANVAYNLNSGLYQFSFYLGMDF
ncbi:MAG: hypothetical protein FWG29_07220 [Treponema sp.]|nr:hypothetical protein [Treponema sp.]